MFSSKIIQARETLQEAGFQSYGKTFIFVGLTVAIRYAQQMLNAGLSHPVFSI